MGDVRPLAEVVAQLHERQRILDAKDSELSLRIAELEAVLRAGGLRRVVRVRIDKDGAELAWSGARGRWRFVIVDPGFRPVDLLSVSREERCSVFADGHMERLIKEITG